MSIKARYIDTLRLELWILYNLRFETVDRGTRTLTLFDDIAEKYAII